MPFAVNVPLRAGMHPVSAATATLSGIKAVQDVVTHIIDLRERSEGFKEFAEYVPSCQWMHAFSACLSLDK
jgi:hypothetical protein